MSLSDEEKVLDYTGIDGVRGVLVYYPKEDVKEFIEKIKRIITLGCLGTSANCYKIKKKVDEEAGGKLA